MSRTLLYGVCVAALICQATLIPGELACRRAEAQQPQGRPVRRPNPQNPPATPKNAPKPVVADANLLSMELKALRILRGFEATPHQLNVIARTAKTTAGSPGNRDAARASAPYVEALVQMRHAFIANDEDQIEKLHTKLDELEEKNPPDLDDQVELTDGAEIEAVRLLNIFSPQQIVAYAQSLEDEFPDPVQLIVEGLDDGRGLKKEEWETARNKIADEVGWLICGMQGEKASKLEEQVSAYLDQKHAEEVKGGNREAEVRKLLGSPGPVVVLKNVMEHTLAELLSNPQVEKAARDCLRQGPHAVAQDAPHNAGEKPVEPPHRGPRNDAAPPRRPEPRPPAPMAKRVELDDVLKSPEEYEGQQLKFDVTVTGTAQARLPANLWLAVKSGSGTVVPAALRGQKLTFVVAKGNAPDAIKEMNEGGTVSVSLTCTIRRDGKNEHWSAFVRSVEVRGK
jgi:hypothetical protein